MTKIYIIIQGPTRSKQIVEQVCNSWLTISDKCHLIYSTWNSEPEQILQQIKNFNIQLVTSDLPLDSGFQNIMCQIKSTHEGLKICEPNSICIKTRSDLILSDPLKFLEEIKKIDFTQIKIATIHNYDRFAMISDFIVIGNYQQMNKFWAIPISTPPLHAHAEVYLQNRFFERQSLQTDWKIVKQKENDFFIELVKAASYISPEASQVTWLKNNKLIQIESSKEFGNIAWPHI